MGAEAHTDVLDHGWMQCFKTHHVHFITPRLWQRRPLVVPPSPTPSVNLCNPPQLYKLEVFVVKVYLYRQGHTGSGFVAASAGLALSGSWAWDGRGSLPTIR